jgi:hypothetical protein
MQSTWTLHWKWYRMFISAWNTEKYITSLPAPYVHDDAVDRYHTWVCVWRSGYGSNPGRWEGPEYAPCNRKYTYNSLSQLGVNFTIPCNYKCLENNIDSFMLDITIFEECFVEYPKYI